MFRTKMMTVDDWGKLQDDFTDRYIDTWHGDARMALFQADALGEPEHLILIPLHRAHLVEELSPGGWADYEDPTDRRWNLIVGNDDAFERFGLQSPAD